MTPRVLAAFVILATACSTFDAPTGPMTQVEGTAYERAAPIPDNGIRLSHTSVRLKPGETVQLVGGLHLRREFQRGVKVNFASTDPSIASVTRAGLVKALKPGVVDIVVTTPAPHAYSAIARITVEGQAGPSIQILQPLANSVVGPVHVLMFTTNDGSAVFTCDVSGMEIPCFPGAEIEIGLWPGSYVFRVRGVNTLGHATTVSVPYTVR